MNGGNLRLTYKRRDDAEMLNVVAQSSTTMDAGSWTTLTNGVNGVVINVTENGTAPDDVEVAAADIALTGKPILECRQTLLNFWALWE